MRQILWGFFKKIVIADNCAEFVNLIFSSPTDYSGSTLVVGAIFFSFQIYGDFSGYSDIAIGTSKLFGFNLMKNFAFPYFSRDIAEFWRRWHISLSTWFRDYLYIPLGGSQVRTTLKIRNTFIIFILSVIFISFKGLNYGIDFKGGTLIELRTDTSVNASAIRDSLKSMNLGDVNVKKFGKEGDYLIKVEQKKSNNSNLIPEIKKTLANNLNADVDFRRVENVGPKVSSELLESSIIAISLALAAMLFYIWIRF